MNILENIRNICKDHNNENEDKNSFLYVWEDKHNNKFYVGTHLGNENDGYVCSGKKMLEVYKNNKNFFKRYILLYGDYEKLIEVESTILKFFDAKNNSCFYNQHNGDGKFLHNQPHTSETKKKMTEAWSNRKEEFKLGHWLGKKLSEEHKMKLSEAAKKRSKTNEGIEHNRKSGIISSLRRQENYSEIQSIKTKNSWILRHQKMNARKNNILRLQILEQEESIL